METIEIKYSPKTPPAGIYEKARDMFGVDFRQGVVFTVGDTIHSQTWPLTPDLLTHEKTHVIQQDGYEGGSNCLQKPYNIHRNRLKTLAFYY